MKGRFTKGQIPWNKGKKGIHLSPTTEFKEDQFVGKEHPSWKGGLQHNKTDCKYRWTGNGKRERNPRLVYEKFNGPIPEGFVVVHLDNDRYNDAPENLAAISRAESLKRNQHEKL